MIIVYVCIGFMLGVFSNEMKYYYNKFYVEENVDLLSQDLGDKYKDMNGENSSRNGIDNTINVENSKFKAEFRNERFNESLCELQAKISDLKKTLEEGIDGSTTSSVAIQKLYDSADKMKELEKFSDKVASFFENSKKIIGDKDWFTSIYDQGLEFYNEYLSFIGTLDIVQKLALGQMIFYTVLLYNLFSLTIIIYGEMLLNYYKLEDKYPKLGGFIRLRRKFQQFYLFINLVSIALILLGLLYLNYSLFIQ